MFSRSNNQITITQEEKMTPACCQRGVPVTLVMADPDDPFVVQITEAIKAFVYQTRYGIRLKMADRALAVDTSTPVEEEDAEANEVEYDINYHAKIKKTKNAANGRQQNRREKDAELSNDIRKTTKKIAKVIISKACLPIADISAGVESTPISIKPIKPSKQELRKNTKMRSNKRVYKTHQACSCICAKRNLAVHGCLCT